MNFYLSTDAHAPDWDAFVAGSPWGHLLQSSAWGSFKSEFGWQVLRIIGESKGRIACGAQALIRSTPGGPTVYVPRGPVLSPDDEALPALLDTLSAAARDRGAIFLKVEPNWPKNDAAAGQLQSLGFRPSQQTIQPSTTLILDLRPDDDTILMQMKPKWRYNIRLATRKGVKIRRAGEADLPAFYELMKATSARDEFAIHQRDYYESAWRHFHPDGLAELFLAFYEDELLAGLMAFRFGSTAYYLYGASSDRHRNRMPNHLLQWHAIQWAKQHGCTWYDFWGIPDATSEPMTRDGNAVVRGKGDMWGVYRFKQGFGGQIVQTVGSFDRVFKPARYWLGTRLWSLAKGRLT
ncbi:MAG: peptidoglycan bridge formation glycyltransferase FemA/FemB family protein [Chloroflexi bacterium]|nr:MAG: peptidoglycan bridge formation glycyltransferase FemA/FemB family protein [Chloroflexota bacterium]